MNKMRPDKIIYTINLSKRKMDSEEILKEFGKMEQGYNDYQTSNENFRRLLNESQSMPGFFRTEKINFGDRI